MFQVVQRERREWDRERSGKVSMGEDWTSTHNNSHRQLPSLFPSLSSLRNHFEACKTGWERDWNELDRLDAFTSHNEIWLNSSMSLLFFSPHSHFFIRSRAVLCSCLPSSNHGSCHPHLPGGDPHPSPTSSLISIHPISQENVNLESVDQMLENYQGEEAFETLSKVRKGPTTIRM